ncbi:probable transcription factor At1g11510 [Humulus lupulus]|uniref:probable transcription factor At1g11510 n=1 Tax=Humulus lupulus TaxID=3486 RepID=UPI002B412417|nr:probable transcription factor At1g11510 [Humulus lupulus]
MEYEEAVVPDSQSDSSDSDQSMPNQTTDSKAMPLPTLKLSSKKDLDLIKNERLKKQLADSKAMPPPPPVKLHTTQSDLEKKKKKKLADCEAMPPPGLKRPKQTVLDLSQEATTAIGSVSTLEKKKKKKKKNKKKNQEDAALAIDSKPTFKKKKKKKKKKSKHDLILSMMEDGNGTVSTSKEKKMKQVLQVADKAEAEAGVGVADSCDRVWSECDEIFVLQNIIEFIEKNGLNHNNIGDTISDSYDVVVAKAESLALEPRLSRKQLIDKVSNLKNRFLDNELRKGGDRNDSLSFSNPHHQKVYQLSRMIWGTADTAVNEGNTIPVQSSDHNNATVKNNKANIQSMLKDYVSHHGLDLSWVEKSTKHALADRWLKFKEDECKYLSMKGKLESEMQSVKLNVYRKRFGRHY